MKINEYTKVNSPCKIINLYNNYDRVKIIQNCFSEENSTKIILSINLITKELFIKDII